MKNLNDLTRLNKFTDKDYRDEFMQTKVRSGIAYQIQALRRKFGLTQIAMGKKTGKTQSVIARLSDTEYGKVTVQTLLDIACGLNVALIVKFVSYPDFLAQTSDMSDRALQVATLEESVNSAFDSVSRLNATHSIPKVLARGNQIVETDRALNAFSQQNWQQSSLSRQSTNSAAERLQ